jgi:hypothetical protein
VRATRLVLASIAAGGALALSLAVPASAATDPVGCVDLNSGAAGLTCTHVGSNLYPGIAARVGLPPVNVGARLGVLTPTCDNVSGLLVQARLAARTDGKTLLTDRAAAVKAHQDLVAAQKADMTALAVRNAAVATAQQAYTMGQPYVTPAADAAALAARNTAIANANSNYQTGGTAAALTAAQTAANAADARCAADKRAADADAALVVNLGVDLTKCQTPAPCNCTTTPPVPTSTDTPVPLPAPIAPAPVVISPPVTVVNPQVGIVPQGAAPTGAVNPADRYAG